MNDASDHEPTETVDRGIRVHILRDDNRERIDVSSVDEAISTVKRSLKNPAVARKIEVDGEILYHSERNGDIKEWERAYKRARTTMGTTESVYECPYDNPGCYENDYCIECQMDRAADSARK
jgi:hypothetical protein